MCIHSIFYLKSSTITGNSMKWMLNHLCKFSEKKSARWTCFSLLLLLLLPYFKIPFVGVIFFCSYFCIFFVLFFGIYADFKIFDATTFAYISIRSAILMNWSNEIGNNYWLKQPHSLPWLPLLSQYPLQCAEINFVSFFRIVKNYSHLIILAWIF